MVTKRKGRGQGEVDDCVGVVSGVITCRPPMRCARRRAINYDRTTPAPKDEKATPALSTTGELLATRMEFLKLPRLSDNSPRLRRQELL